MRAVVQRVHDCTVSVEGQQFAKITRGLLVYLGVAHGDAQSDIDYMVDKLANLRIFPDEYQKMNLSILDCGGQVCVVSQFTLLGDVRQGRRPSWDGAAPPEIAKTVYETTCQALRDKGLAVEKGVFQAHMAVAYTNDGPVTILLDSRKLF